MDDAKKNEENKRIIKEIGNLKPLPLVSLERKITSFLNKKKWSEKDVYFRGEHKNFDTTPTTLKRRIPRSYQDPQSHYLYIEAIIKLREGIRLLGLKRDTFINTIIDLRHKGVPTPLIDLSEQKRIAFFFACLPNHEGNEKSKINEESENEGGYVKIYRRKNFTVIDVNEFNETYDSNIASWMIDEKSVENFVLINVESGNPNIVKQDSILCFPKKGIIKEEICFHIKEGDKKEIIDYLRQKRVETQRLFSGSEGIDTYIRLETNFERKKNKKSLQKLFCDYNIRYKNISVWEAREKSNEDLQLILLDTFSCFEGENKQHLLFILSKEISVNDNTNEDLEEMKNITKRSMLRFEETPKTKISSIIIQLLSPLRLFKSMKGIKLFSVYLDFLLEYKLPFSREIMQSESARYFEDAEERADSHKVQKKVLNSLFERFTEYVRDFQKSLSSKLKGGRIKKDQEEEFKAEINTALNICEFLLNIEIDIPKYFKIYNRRWIINFHILVLVTMITTTVGLYSDEVDDWKAWLNLKQSSLMKIGSIMNRKAIGDDWKNAFWKYMIPGKIPTKKDREKCAEDLISATLKIKLVQ